MRKEVARSHYASDTPPLSPPLLLPQQKSPNFFLRKKLSFDLSRDENTRAPKEFFVFMLMFLLWLMLSRREEGVAEKSDKREG